MPGYHPRHLEEKLKLYAEHFKIILVTGARQVGKSTLLRHCLPQIKGFIFDPIQDLYGARKDPDLFLDSHPEPLLLDEIQFAPELLPALKRRVDKLKRNGCYFLTGSQNLSILKTVSESLAGRVGILNLEGMTIYEFLKQPNHSWLTSYLKSPSSLPQKINQNLKTDALVKILWRGSLPGTLELPDQIIPDYFRSYIQTYVERDVRLLENIREFSTFDRFLGLSAALCSQEINNSQLGREIGITPATARRWLDLLENTFQWIELFPYHGNTIKRISGKRKGFWRDTGITCYLQRITSPEALAVSPLLGSIFESWVINTIFRLTSSLLSVPPQMYHWRTAGGAEVDLVLELDGSLFPIEIKCKTVLSGHDTSGLRAFRETYKNQNIAPALIIYAGNECYQIDRQTTAIPWNAISTHR